MLLLPGLDITVSINQHDLACPQGHARFGGNRMLTPQRQTANTLGFEYLSQRHGPGCPGGMNHFTMHRADQAFKAFHPLLEVPVASCHYSKITDRRRKWAIGTLTQTLQNIVAGAHDCSFPARV